MRNVTLAGMLILAGVVAAQAAAMKPTARDKMTAPDQKAQMQACEDQAKAQNVKMEERSKFVMDCMTKGAK